MFFRDYRVVNIEQTLVSLSSFIIKANLDHHYIAHSFICISSHQNTFVRSLKTIESQNGQPDIVSTNVMAIQYRADLIAIATYPCQLCDCECEICEQATLVVRERLQWL